MKRVLILGLCACASWAAAADGPPADAFRIFPPAAKEAPVITAYLQYQTEMAWQQDDERRKEWSEIKTEQDLLAVQRHAEERLLAMLGGLPSERTPLHPRITGKIQMDGFRIEKLIFESLPGVYVSALVYVPEDGSEKHPAILVPAGHAENGKMHYQALCQRLVQRGYVVIAWDPVGQGERSQFWDAKAGKSRYNLICAEHAVLGNLAYLAGTNLARWEIWDGIRAVDYLLTRPEVDPERINITGTSGGGFQAAHIAALDRRIKVAAPSCYITALPMRVYNRIFQDPDSDPEQDLYGMISNHVDNAGLLLMMYPRPVFVAAAVLDFFPIEGAHKTVREVTELYSKFQHPDRIGMAEGYHGHEFSPENQEAAMNFLDHFNGLPLRRGLPPVKELDDKTLQCTRTGQVMLEFEDARSLMDVIREYYVQHKLPGETLSQLYYSDRYPRINSWSVAEFEGEIPGREEIRWETRGSSQFKGVTIDKYVLHHSRYLELPLLYFHKADGVQRSVLLWLGKNGKATAQDWSSLTKYLDAGYDIVSVDPRGLGETRMAYKAASPDDPALARLDFDRAYASPISGVLADYVYNSILTGRPYFLQMIEDVEIATRFFKAQRNIRAEFSVAGSNGTFTLASAISETLPNIKLLSEPDGNFIPWSELVNQKTELWPIEYLLPSGAYIH
ncbi:MAG TPA: acetylxylan esterase [Candidatus Sulfotelmatobacter sp.]|nr:acetylxylan esterase [Candidatus Sulfotelmatobacter sp.]